MKKFLSRALVPALAAVSAVAAPATTASAAEFIPCNGGPTQVCYTETGQTSVRYDIPDVAPGEVIPVAQVAAYLDIYRIPVGTGGVQIPCISAVVNGSVQDNCARLGFTLVQRTALVNQAVAAQLVKVSGTLGSVYVCTAELTATVANVGITNLPILSACAENLPQFQTM